MENINLMIIQNDGMSRKTTHSSAFQKRIILKICVSTEQQYQHLLNAYDIREHIKVRTIVVNSIAVDNGQ